ncbi:aminotransferase, partial [Staphylococcus pseudintermedius]
VNGGGQEYGVRSGTVNLPNDIAMVKAMKIANENFEALNAFVTELNNDVRQFLNKYHGVYINSSTSGSPIVLNISFPGVKG